MGEQYYQDLTHGDQYYYATVYPSAFGVFISLGMRGAVMYGIVRFGAIHVRYCEYATVLSQNFCVSQKGVMWYFWYSQVWYGKVMVRHGNDAVVWFGMVRYGMGGY